MGKIGAYQLASISLDAEQFREDVTNVINLGKVAISSGVNPPNWNAQPGEQFFQFPASGGTTLYFYRNSAWVAGWSITV